MTGGTASSTTLGTQINNMDGVVINSEWNVNGSVGNGPIRQDAFAQATGGTFSLGLDFQNLVQIAPDYRAPYIPGTYSSNRYPGPAKQSGLYQYNIITGPVILN